MSYLKILRRNYNNTAMRILSKGEILNGIRNKACKNWDHYMEIILAKPDWRIKFKPKIRKFCSYITSEINPYGHSAVGYGSFTNLASEIPPTIMNISGSKRGKMVNFFDPKSYLFSDGEKEGDQQGGINKRTFTIVRIKATKDEVIKIDNYFRKLSNEEKKGKVKFTLISHILINKIRSIFGESFLIKYCQKYNLFGYNIQSNSYRQNFLGPLGGNCAYWSGLGFVETGHIAKTSSWPLALLLRIWYNAVNKNPSNVIVITFKSKNHMIEPEGLLLWPFYWLKNSYNDIWYLDKLSNYIVRPIQTDTENDYNLIIEKQENVYEKWENMIKKIKKICEKF
jgi:hypothetical protein